MKNKKLYSNMRDDEFLDLQKNKERLKFVKTLSKKVEKDVRSILDIVDEDKPVILDLESVRVVKPGKFEIDLVSLLNRKPIVFKIQEGKYIIDIESGLPSKKKEEEED